MPRRKHKAEHMRRVARPGRGLTRSQARRHAKARERLTKVTLPIDDPRFQTAIREMNREHSLTAAARASHISFRRLRRVLAQHRLIKRKHGRWVIKDHLLRRVLIMSRGRPQAVIVQGYKRARLVGEHHQAAAEFVRSNDIDLIKPFRGQIVQAANGRRYPLETDPNALHRIAAMDTPPFHEIYEIIAPT